MVNYFQSAFDKFENRPYDWPKVSCISFIEQLSEGLKEKPNYFKWKKRSELRCHALLRRMSGDLPTNYIREHEKCLGSAWNRTQTHLILQPKAGQIVFAATANGMFVDENSMETVRWEFPHPWPAVIFPDGNGAYWAFSPEHGLKKVHDCGAILAVFRRVD